VLFRESSEIIINVISIFSIQNINIEEGKYGKYFILYLLTTNAFLLLNLKISIYLCAILSSLYIQYPTAMLHFTFYQ